MIERIEIQRCTKINYLTPLHPQVYICGNHDAPEQWVSCAPAHVYNSGGEDGDGGGGGSCGGGGACVRG